MTVTADKGVSVQGGAKVGASGAMTVDANDGVTVKDASYVGANGTLKVGMAEGKTTASLTVQDTAQLVARDSLSAKVGGDVTVRDSAKVGSDKDVSLASTSGNVVVRDAAKVVAAGKGDAEGATDAISVKAGGNVDIDGVVMAKADDVVVEAVGTVTVSDKASSSPKEDDAVSGLVQAKGGNVKVASAGSSVTLKDGAKLDASKDIEVSAKTTVGINNTAEVEAGKSVTIASTDTAAASAITIDTTGSVTANDGSVKIDNKNGNVTIQNATVEAKGDSGSVDIDANGGLVSVKDATVTSEKKDITIVTAGTSGGNVIIDTGVTMTADQNVDIVAAKAVTLNSGITANKGYASVDANDGEITMAKGTTLKAGTDATFKATGDIKLAAVTAGETAGTASFTTTGGSITDNNGDDNVNVTAQNAVFSAAAGAVGTGANHVETSVATVAATSKDGVFLTEKDGVTVGTVGGVSGLKSTDSGAVVLEATAGNVTVSQAVEANGSAGNVLIAANADSGDVTIGETVTAEQNAMMIAGNDVKVNSDVTANGGDAYVEARNGNVEMASGTKVWAKAMGRNARIAAKGNVELSQVEAANVSVKAVNGDITDALDAETANVKAPNLRLEAGGDVGLTTDNLNVNVDNLEVKAGGNAIIAENDAVKVGGVGAVTVAKVDSTGAATGPQTDGDLTGIDAAGTATLVADGKVTVSEAVNVGNNLLVNATTGGIEQNAAMAAVNNASVIAGAGDVNQNADITATGGDAYVEAKGGDVNMSAGTTVRGNADSGTAFVGASGTLNLSKVEANTVWLKTGGSIENTTVNGGGVTANNLLLEAGGHIGKLDDKLQIDAGTIAAKADGGGVYVSEAKSVTVGSVDASVEKVLADGTFDTPKFSGGQVGISATGDVSLDVGGEMLTVNSTISGSGDVEVSASGGVTLGKDSKVKGDDVVITASDDIVQEGDVSVTVNNGNVSNAPEIHAAIEADGKATLISTGGSIGSAKSGTSSYVGVKTGTGKDDGVTASAANGSVAIAAGENTDLVLANSGGTDGKGGIVAKDKVAVYTQKTIKPNGAVIKGSSIAVTGKDFEGGNVTINIGGGELTVNNEKSGQTFLAIFETTGGNGNVRVNNQPNKAVVFVDGRLAGGDLQTINRLGSMEAFPVQTPELKSEQGVFGNPIFLHDELGVANPLAVGAIDFLLLDIPRLILSSDFPLEIEKQVAAAGLNPTTSYWFGQNSGENEKKDGSNDSEDGNSGDGGSTDEKGGGETPVAGDNQTAMN